MKKIYCSILTPERYLFEGDIAFAVVQAYNGELGFLVDHTPLISELGIGEVRLMDGQKTEYFLIERGVVEIKNNRLIILAENAYKKDELNIKDIEDKLNGLKEQKGLSWKEIIHIQAERDRFKAHLKVARR